jgi:hypothetical protein
MKTSRLAFGSLAAAFVAASAMAGCGGGYAASYQPPGPSPSPTPPPSPGIEGNLNVTTGGTYPNYTGTAAGMLNVVFSCGCSSQAGIGTTDAGGNYVIVSPATATPATTPNPTYTLVPTRNYIVVAQPGSGAGPQAWQMVFAGNVPSHDLALAAGPTAAPATSSASDAFTAAATLYVYYNSGTGSLAFDQWNFNTVQTFTHNLATAANPAEVKLMNDIAALGKINGSLFPTAPTWNPGQPVSGLIQNDLIAVKGSADATIPTPCPTAGCTGTPAP